MVEQETLPQYLVHRYKTWGDKKIAMRQKEFGIWKEYTWKDSFEAVKYFALGLLSLGLQNGDKVSIIGRFA